VAAKVFSALYAGNTTAMRFPLIMNDHHNLFACVELACGMTCVGRVSDPVRRPKGPQSAR
jgi:hypothetical protein